MDVRYQNAIDYFSKTILAELAGIKINAWVAGGALRNYFTGERINSDIDIFFDSNESVEIVKKYFDDNDDYELVYETDNSYKYLRNNDNKTIDVIKKIFASPAACINEFDFTICQIAITQTEVIFGEHTLLDLSKRQLMIVKISYPYSTLHRMVRYLNKGFHICMEELDKIHDSIQLTNAPDDEEDSNDEEIISSSRSQRSRFHFD